MSSHLWQIYSVLLILEKHYRDGFFSREPMFSISSIFDHAGPIGLFVMAILIFFSVNLVREIINRQDLQKEIDKLQADIDNIESRNDELGNLMEYFKSIDFVEEVARTKLNLRKPGENIIIVPEEGDNTETDNQLSAFIKTDIKTLSNPQRWWSYFFKQ